jgi:hypothetical protein
MKGKIPDSAIKNLSHSIKYTVNFTRMLLKKGKPDFVCENIIQVIKDIFLLKNGMQLRDNAATGVRELGISLNEVELYTIGIIEKSMRKEKYYKETCAFIKNEILNSILMKIERYME